MNDLSNELTAGADFVIHSEPNTVHVLSGYEGPLSDADLDYPLPARQLSIGTPEVSTEATIQIDGRLVDQEMKWSGLRVKMRVDALNVAKDQSHTNLFTTHLGKAVAGKAHWTEIGIVRSAHDPVYRLFTYDPYQSPQWKFFGEAQLGKWYEFAIRLKELGQAPYTYETFCDGICVRTGTLPLLDNQVDINHETWSDTAKFCTGDRVTANEAWVNFPPKKARWLAPDIKVNSYSSNTSIKKVRLYQVPQKLAYEFESTT